MCGLSVWRSPWNSPAASSLLRNNSLPCGRRTGRHCWPSSSRSTWVRTRLSVCPPVHLLCFCWLSTRSAFFLITSVCVCVCAGVKGRVLDSSGVPAQNALVEVKGRSNLCPFRTDRHGEYYRLLLPGRYTFTVKPLLRPAAIGWLTLSDPAHLCVIDRLVWPTTSR